MASSATASQEPTAALEHLRPVEGVAEPSPLACFWRALCRKKPLDCRTDTGLNRCLNMLDLTALGVGSTLGLGLYVLAGEVASTKAGPAVVLSFGLAALASAFSALCYAEFAGRVPRAGSAYAYSYITVGEFVAFVIGWNLILEYVIGASCVARAFSVFLRFVVAHPVYMLGFGPNPRLELGPQNNSISLSTNSTIHLAQDTIQANLAPLEAVVYYLTRFFDLPTVIIIAMITVFILLGVKSSTNATLSFTTLNLLVVTLVVGSSLPHLDLNNWSLPKDQVPERAGEGGFLPFGWAGVLKGASTCFFAFIGFDTIASSAEEAKSPKRNVPLSILLSLFISSVAYMLMSAAQTLLWPYHDQNTETSLLYIFNNLQMDITYWVVLLGGTVGLASSLLGGMYPLPRILYSMAHDKLIYGPLAHINRRLKLPVRATVVGSVLVAILACLFSTKELADMVSMGTLAAYTLVSLSVLILRYEKRDDSVDDSTLANNHLAVSNILDASAGAKHQQVMMIPLKEKGDCNGGHQQVERKRSKLSAKPSTPIREKGSKALTPQLSVGFNSWFKSQQNQENGENNQQQVGNPPTQRKRRSLLNLLLAWRLDEQQVNCAPDEESSRQSKLLITVIVVACIILNLVAWPLRNTVVMEGNHYVDTRLLLISAASIVTLVLVAAMIMLSRLPVSQDMSSDMFQVPLVPLIPTLSIIINICLMLTLKLATWYQFTTWMAVGLFIYFTYGIWNSEGYLMYLHR